MISHILDFFFQNTRIRVKNAQFDPGYLSANGHFGPSIERSFSATERSFENDQFDPTRTVNLPQKNLHFAPKERSIWHRTVILLGHLLFVSINCYEMTKIPPLSHTEIA